MSIIYKRMPVFTEIIKLKIRPYTRYIIIGLVSLIFFIVAIYSYFVFMQKRLLETAKKYQDVANEGSGNSGKSVSIMFFFADWCPHCNKAKPSWSAFKDEYNGDVVNNYVIQCIEYDCSDNETHKSTLNKYKVDSFPTIILLKDNVRYDFDAKITKSSLEQFIETSTKI